MASADGPGAIRLGIPRKGLRRDVAHPTRLRRSEPERTSGKNATLDVKPAQRRVAAPDEKVRGASGLRSNPADQATCSTGSRAWLAAGAVPKRIVAHRDRPLAREVSRKNLWLPSVSSTEDRPVGRGVEPFASRTTLRRAKRPPGHAVGRPAPNRFMRRSCARRGTSVSARHIGRRILAEVLLVDVGDARAAGRP